MKDKVFDASKFLPTVDTFLCFWWRSLLNHNFPNSVDNYKDFGNEVLSIVNINSDLYNKMVDLNEQAAFLNQNLVNSKRFG